MAQIIPSPLYRTEDEHDACGVGFIANMHGRASYDILDRAIVGLKNLAHRGAIDADAVTGDGAGVLTQIPKPFFEKVLDGMKVELSEGEGFGVGMIFLCRNDKAARDAGKAIFEKAVEAEGFDFLGWRKVPVDTGCLGQKAELTRPFIVQALIRRPADINESDFERKLLLIQKTADRTARAEAVSDFYIVSLSCRTVTYKGLLNAPQVRRFFVDLKSPLFQTAYAIFHQRFATNTFPDWNKAQPYRMLAHNGEINTIRGNRKNMAARQFSDEHGVWGDRFKDLQPMVQPDMSDSASFDNALQLTTVGGRHCIHGVSIMMPSAWENNPGLSPEVRDFYKYHAVMMEPWDGPAAIVFTDGRFIAAALDRNGLRPARYKVYDDGTVILASEIGLIPGWGARTVEANRLGPGRMLAVDLQESRLLRDEEIRRFCASQGDYSDWCRRCIHNIHTLAGDDAAWDAPTSREKDLLPLRVANGIDVEEEKLILLPMIENGKEGLGSMGDDTPLAVMSRKPRLLYTYFKQLFAQVTNPAIDSLRERMVMSLKMHLGGRLGLFDDMVKDHAFLALDTPVLFDHEYDRIFTADFLKGTVFKLSLNWEVASGPEGMEPALKRLRAEARKAVEDKGARVLILSDRGVGPKEAAIPTLLGVAAVHSELVQAGKRMQCDIVAESAEVRDVHQMACVLGFGANAIYPYFAFDVIRSLVREGKAQEGLSPEEAIRNYRTAIDNGILKIMSKMGISTLFSYQGAAIFEALGVSKKVVDDCFTNTACPIGGIGYEHIATETLTRHAEAFASQEELALDSMGYFAVKKGGEGEFHGWNPKVVSGMNLFNRKGGEFSQFKTFRDASDFHQPTTIKDLLKFRYPRDKAVPLDEVEGIEDIRRRFTTAGMSLGALSPEMHECLAVAMNRIGGKSNSGEGGEDPRRFHPDENGDSANSAIKQVASGRFGVSAEYLSNAREIEIKIAQGAKPGEGGQLMGWKVSPLIARLRFSVPGVTLISPPPHHDIYSIEDLAQLIFDLKEVNPRAKVCVKLVSSSGVGTIAAGVAKAYADVILISGHDGGTGASPLSSIKNAGSAWEIGLAEAHQVLMMNGLRSRVVLRTDGGMKTGRDIVLAAILGAEEYNFGTAALIAGGCAMFRVCHLNSCPVGVATQREDLRAKFKGKPEYIINFFNAVANDVRIIMAKLGLRTIDQLVGRTDLLEQLDDPANPKTKTISFAGILHNPDPSGELDRIHTRERNDRFGNEGSLDDQILQEAKETLTHRKPIFNGTYKITNVNRNVGTRMSGEVAYMHGNQGLQPGTVNLTFKGSAGQSFGTFLVQGIRLQLFGEANDYVGKGMNGGEIVIRPRENESFAWHENIIMGNTCLYGATGGYLFGAGGAGERFAVRNSGATTVVEGVGEHACEYMTRGTVVVLGPTGRNFGAGMSGGLAFVWDPDETLETNLNPEMVFLERLDNNSEIEALFRIVQLHARLTTSPHAQRLLDNWDNTLRQFWRVAPHTAPDVPKPVFNLNEEIESILV
ncbi:MAG: glutamate synthase large subunit [Opitutales bacterium]